MQAGFDSVDLASDRGRMVFDRLEFLFPFGEKCKEALDRRTLIPDRGETFFKLKDSFIFGGAFLHLGCQCLDLVLEALHHPVCTVEKFALLDELLDPAVNACGLIVQRQDIGTDHFDRKACLFNGAGSSRCPGFQVAGKFLKML